MPLQHAEKINAARWRPTGRSCKSLESRSFLAGLSQIIVHSAESASAITYFRASSARVDSPSKRWMSNWFPMLQMRGNEL